MIILPLLWLLVIYLIYLNYYDDYVIDHISQLIIKHEEKMI